MRFLRLCFGVWEEGRCGSLQGHLNAGGWIIAKKADQTPQPLKFQREIPRLRLQRQSWYNFLTAAGDDQKARLVDTRRPRPGMRFGDILPPHHLHGDDGRGGRHRQSAEE